ncbi:unnamed protein product [Gongylonema pulchrum]|uniref:AMP-binding_C domain-containing protein n=1 Tax=Gongylonema pulchrum TaxID=637853 RepID=A0A183DL51_9BILA|nr:unnamed protein product [Gongylonema pulchrum]
MHWLASYVADKTGAHSLETGGCEVDYETFLLQHPAIEVHPYDRVPLLGKYDKGKIHEYCQL